MIDIKTCQDCGTKLRVYDTRVSDDGKEVYRIRYCPKCNPERDRDKLIYSTEKECGSWACLYPTKLKTPA